MTTVETCSQTTASGKDAVLSHKHGQSISKAWTQWGTGNVLSSEALPGPLTKHRTKRTQGHKRTALILHTDVGNPQFNCSSGLVICTEYSDSVTRTANVNRDFFFWPDNVVLLWFCLSAPSKSGHCLHRHRPKEWVDLELLLWGYCQQWYWNRALWSAQLKSNCTVGTRQWWECSFRPGVFPHILAPLNCWISA